MNKYNIENLSVEELLMAYHSLEKFEWPVWLLGKAPRGWEKAPNIKYGTFDYHLLRSRYKMAQPVKTSILERLGAQCVEWAENVGSIYKR